jgi:hypothetical protein
MVYFPKQDELNSLQCCLRITQWTSISTGVASYFIYIGNDAVNFQMSSISKNKKIQMCILQRTQYFSSRNSFHQRHT